MLQEDTSGGGFLGRMLLSVLELSFVSKHYCRGDARDSDSGGVSGSGIHAQCRRTWLGLWGHQPRVTEAWLGQHHGERPGQPRRCLAQGSWLGDVCWISGDQVQPPLGGLSAHSRGFCAPNVIPAKKETDDLFPLQDRVGYGLCLKDHWLWFNILFYS